MLVQLNTDNYIEGSERLQAYVQSTVEAALGRFGERITRVIVRLTDDNSDQKTGENDKRCTIEARLAGLQPIIVSHEASSVSEALDGASDILEKTIDRTLGRLQDPKGRTSFSGQ